MKRDEAIKQVDQALEELNAALSKGQSERLTRYLEVMAKFHRYSFGNVLLILQQRPEASHVAGFHRWRQLGRHVKKGETGIGILAPLVYKRNDDDGEQDERRIRGFKIVHVFDVSQTEGDELPEFASVEGDAGDHLTRIEQVIRGLGIELVYGALPPGTLGACGPDTITIRPELSDTEKFSIAVHELSHSRLHQGDRRQETTKRIRETEAEACAFVVCRAFGLDSKAKSADYISLYRGTTETLSESLEFIQKTSAWIIKALNELEPSEPLELVERQSETPELGVAQ